MNIIEKFMTSVSKPNGEEGCWIWTGYLGKRRNKNYGYFHLIKGECLAHRASYMLFKGPIPEKLQILHNCDNPPCVNPNHLYAGTAQDNVDDREKRGRSKHAIKESHGRAKLTEENVKEIRSTYIPNLSAGRGGLKINSQQYFANKYGVTKRVIRLILRNETWKDPNYKSVLTS